MSWGAPRVRQQVSASAELWRVVGLPRRSWTPEHLRYMQGQIDPLVCKPGGTMRSLPVQAWALSELHRGPGLFCPIGVGEGKTLISLTAPLITQAQRPLLLVPAALVDKTRREERALSQHFRIPNHTRILSYELAGRVQAAQTIERWQPDLIIADEVHRLKNKKAAVTKRVSRYMHEHPGTRFVALSGTITKRSLRDYAHILQWCLGAAHMPLPVHWAELESWAAALDQDADEDSTHFGALIHLCAEGDAQDLPGIRSAYRRRLTETWGVISTPDKAVDCSLVISRDVIKLPDHLRAAIQQTKATWTTPNGEAFADAFSLYRHVRELLLGLFYLWDPAAPREWLDARKSWASLCRAILQHNNRRLDSELQVTNAVDQGFYPEATQALADWRAVKNTFTPRTIPVWLDDTVLNHVAAELQKHPGTICWIEHVHFGLRLARMTGLSYYQAQGLDERGRSIEDAPAGVSLLASIESNKEGRNLQRFSRNYFVSMLGDGQRTEQMLGRTHRQGQKEDEVTAKILITGPEHEDAIEKALAQARYTHETLGQAQKLLIADWV